MDCRMSEPIWSQLSARASQRWTSRPPDGNSTRRPSEEEHLMSQARRVGRCLLGNCFGQDREFIPPEAGRDEDNPSVRLLAVHQIPNDLDEVCDVARDEASSLVRREAELLEIEVPRVAGLMRADGIQSALAQELSYTRREILVEVQLRSAMRTRPGYRSATASAVRAVSSAIRRWISSRNRRK